MNRFKVFYVSDFPPYIKSRDKTPWVLTMDGTVIYWFETMSQAMTIGRFLAANEMETSYTIELAYQGVDHVFTETKIVHTYNLTEYHERKDLDVVDSNKKDVFL